MAGYSSRSRGPALLLHSVYGLRPAIRNTAERLSALGFEVVTPDLFEGVTTKDLDEGMALRERWSRDRLLKHLSRIAREQAEAVGSLTLVGFSWGASTAVRLAVQLQATDVPVRGLVLFHGLAAVPASQGLTAPISLHVADDDPLLPLAEVNADLITLEAAGAVVSANTYRASTHLFTDPDHPDSAPDPARAAWERAAQFLRGLPVGGRT